MSQASFSESDSLWEKQNQCCDNKLPGLSKWQGPRWRADRSAYGLWESRRASLCFQERQRGRRPRTCGKLVWEVDSDPSAGTCNLCHLRKVVFVAIVCLFVQWGTGWFLKSLRSLLFWSQDSHSAQKILQCTNFNWKHFGEQWWHSLSFIYSLNIIHRLMCSRHTLDIGDRRWMKHSPRLPETFSLPGVSHAAEASYKALDLVEMLCATSGAVRGECTREKLALPFGWGLGGADRGEAS